MSSLFKLMGELGLDSGPFKKGLASAHGDAKGFASNMNRTMGGIGGGIASGIGMGLKVAGAAIGIASAATIAYGVNAVNQSIKIESAFAGVIKTTDGLVDSSGELNAAGTAMKNTFRDMTMETGTAAEGIMRIGELGGQLGVAASGLPAFTRTITDLSESTNLSVEEGSMALARMAAIMGTSEQDYGRMGSSIVELGNNFATTENDIMQFALRIAGAGALAGVTEADIFGLGAAFSSVGIQAESGGTAVQKVLIDMNTLVTSSGSSIVNNTKAIAKAQADLTEKEGKLLVAMMKQSEMTDKTKASTRLAAEQNIAKVEAEIAAGKEMISILEQQNGMVLSPAKLSAFAKVAGMTAEQFKVAWKEDAGDAFASFITGLGKAGDDAAGILEELEIKDARSTRAFLTLASAGDMVTRSLESSSSAWEENNALTKEAAARYRTTERQIAMFKGTLRDIAVTVGDTLKPLFAGLLGGVGVGLQGFAKNLRTALPAATGRIGAAFTGASEADKAAGGMGIGAGLQAAFAQAGVELEPIKIWLGNKLVEVATFAWNFFKSTFPQVAGGIETAFDVFGKIAAFVGENLVPILAALSVIIVAALVPSVYAMVMSGIAFLAVWGWLVALVILVAIGVGLLVKAWQTDFGGIRTALTEFWEGTAKPIFETLILWFQVNIPLAIAFVTTAFQAIADVWTGIVYPALLAMWTFISEVLAPLFAAIVAVELAAFKLAFEALSALFTNVVVPALTVAYEWLATKLQVVLEALSPITDTFNALIGGLADILTTSLGPVLVTIWQAMTDLGKVITDGVGKAGTWLLEKVVTPLVTWIGSLGDKIKTVTGFLSGLADRLKSLSLPKWLEPGSPTPLETGLVGIAGALLIVIREMSKFATSMTRLEAKKFGDIGEGVQETAEGFAALIKVSQSVSAGGGADIGGIRQTLAYLEEVSLIAMETIQDITDRVGYNEIKKLKQTSARLAFIIEAVQIDFSAMAIEKPPDIALYFTLLRDAIGRAIVLVGDIRNSVGDVLLKQLAVTVGYLTQIAALFQIVLAVKAPDAAFESNLGPFLAGIVFAARQVSIKLDEALLIWGGIEIVAVQAEFAKVLKDILGVLKIDLEMSKMAPKVGFASTLTTFLSNLMMAATAIKPKLDEALLLFGTIDLAKAQGEMAAALTDILGVLGIDLKVEGAGGVTFARQLYTFLQNLIYAAGAIKPKLDEALDIFGDLAAMETYAKISTALAGVMKVLGIKDDFAKLTTGKELGEDEFVIGLEKAIKGLLADLMLATKLLKPGLIALSDEWDGMLDFAVELLGKVSAVITSFATAAEGSRKLKDAKKGSKGTIFDVASIEQALSELGEIGALLMAAQPVAVPVGVAALGEPPTRPGEAGGNVRPLTINLYVDGALIGTNYVEVSDNTDKINILLDEAGFKTR